MGSGKRASMREGPLAALFRKTETEGLPPAAEKEELPPRATPTPEERLRNAFSADVPGDMMAPPGEVRPPTPSTREVPPPAAADYQWGSPRDERVRNPQLRV